MQAVRAPYTDSPDLDTSPEAAFAHQLLLAWAAWSYGAGKLGVRSSADVLNLPVSELRAHKILDEDQLLSIDRAIARLPMQMQRLIQVHYLSSEDEPMTKRYSRLACTRIDYRQRMQTMQATLYTLLLPAIDEWRRSTL